MILPLSFDTIIMSCFDRNAFSKGLLLLDQELVRAGFTAIFFSSSIMYVKYSVDFITVKGKTRSEMLIYRVYGGLVH